MTTSSSTSSLPPVRDRVRVTACLEFLDTEDWGEISPERIQQHLNHWFQQISQRAAQLGGEAQQIQPNIIWLGFSHVETLPALKACMRLCVPLLKKPLYLDGNPVPLRVGIDVEGQVRTEDGSYDTPYPSDPFFIRSHAKPGECIIQGDLVSLLPPSLPTERLTDHSGEELDPEISCYRLLLEKPAYEAQKPEMTPVASLKEAPRVEPKSESFVEEQTVPSSQSELHAKYVNEMQESPQGYVGSEGISSVQPSTQPEPPVQNTPVALTSMSPQLDPQETFQQISQPAHDDDASFDSHLTEVPVTEAPMPVASDSIQPEELSQAQSVVHQPQQPVQMAPAISRPATAPVIPEVVSQRHSVRLPQEPESAPLPVYDVAGNVSPQHVLTQTQSAEPQSATRPTTPVPQPTSPPSAEETADDGTLTLSLELPDYFARVNEPPIPNHNVETVLDGITDFLSPALQPGSTGRLLGLSGISGLGKSVLLNHTLLQKLIPDPASPSIIWFSAACDLDYPTNALPLSFWQQLIQNSIPLGREGGDAEQLTDWLQQSLAPVFGDDWTSETEGVFRNLLAIPRLNDWEPSLPAEQQERLVETLYQFMTRMAHNLPMVVVMDDVDAMDSASQDVWLKLLKRGLTQAAPVSLVFSYGFENQPVGELAQWLETAKAQGHYSSIILEPLTTHQVLNMMGDDGAFAGLERVLSPQLSQQLIDRAGGDFLGVSEYVSYLHALQVFSPDPATGQLVENPKVDQRQVQLPPTPQALVEMRWAHLPGDDQHGLEVAAMLGDKFSVPLWKATVELSERQQKDVLQRLAAYQWIMTDLEQSAQFRHPTFRRYILGQIPQDIQQTYAQQIYAHYRSLHDNGQTIQPVWLAVYADWANLPNEALEAWLATASQANQLGNLTAINMSWNQVFARLDSLQQSGDLTREQQQLMQQITGIQEGLASYNLASHPEVTAEVLPKVVSAYRQQHQLAPMVGALSYLTLANDRIGHVQGALESLDQAIAHVPEHQYPHESLLLKADRLVCLYKLGRYGDLKEALDMGVVANLQQRLAELGEHARATDWAMFQRARWVKMGALWRDGLPQTAERMEALIHEMKRSAGSSVQGHWPCAIRLQLEYIQYLTHCGEYALCKTQLHDVLQQIEQLPHHEALVAEWGQTALTAYIDQSQWDNANDLILHSLHQAEAAKEYRTWVLINISAGRIALSEERYTDAVSIFESMATESANRHMAECALRSWRYLAEAQARLGQTDKARDVLEKALDVARKPEIANKLEEYRLSVALAQLFVANDELKEAGALLQGIWPPLMKTTFSPLIVDAAEAIAHLYKTIAHNAPDDAQRAPHQAKADEFTRIAMEHRQGQIQT